MSGNHEHLVVIQYKMADLLTINKTPQFSLMMKMF